MKNTTISNETTEQNGKQKAIPFVEEANLRDYFAAKAMQGIISGECNYGAFSDLASDAYSIADAMLLAREAS